MKNIELENMWLEYIQREEYNHKPDTEELLAAVREIENGIITTFGEEGRKYLVLEEDKICEYGTVREKEGFFDGFKLAMRIAMESLLYDTKK